MAPANNVFGAEGCLVSQISSFKNMPAEAKVLAGYTRSALITVQGNMYVCVRACVRDRAKESQTYNSEKEVPVGIWLQLW